MGIDAYLNENRNRFEEELNELLRIPSVSTDSTYAGDVKRCADWLAGHLTEAGLETVEVIGTDGHPVVYAEHQAGVESPTVLIYGHYDVQPADPEHLWTSPPFEPEVRDGRVYARGSEDDKGQVHMHAKALEARLRSGAGVPVNVKMVIEGEEEIGSRHLEGFLQENRKRLSCDAVMISDTTMLGPDLPAITSGLRGLAYMEVSVSGPNRDLHSGSYGGAVQNPANALATIIAGLKDEYGRVAVPGFYDRVKEMTGEERASLKAIPFEDDDFQRDLNLETLAGEAGYSTLERLWYRPALDVNGVISGFTGEGAKTVLPSEARAKISMRLVPDQDPEEIQASFKKHVLSLAPDGVDVEVEYHHGAVPWRADPKGPVFEAASAALDEAFDRKPLLIREGGSIPIVPMFESLLDAPVILVGFGLPGANPHAPDEWLDLGVYHKGIAALVSMWGRLG
jgi:acetylornithine deacetylase/succinyl-diaminopimelate desuccinylase-like protein